MRTPAFLRAVDLILWTVAAVTAAAWLALVEVLWLPLRVGTVLLPVSLVAAVVGNLVLVQGVHRLSDSRVIAVLPAVTWIVVAVAASYRRPEGDLLVPAAGDLGLLGLLFLLSGVVAAAVAVGRVLAAPRRPDDRPVSSPVTARHPAGSGTGGAR